LRTVSRCSVTWAVYAYRYVCVLLHHLRVRPSINPAGDYSLTGVEPAAWGATWLFEDRRLCNLWHDHVMFLTNGVTSIRARSFGQREDQWLDVLIRNLGGPALPVGSGSGGGMI